MKKLTFCTFILIICLLGGRIFANPTAPSYPNGEFLMYFGSLAVVAGVVGLIGELGELTILGYYHYNGEFGYIPVSCIIGVPIGFIFPGEGRLFYITNPQFAHKDGDFFPAIEIVPELEFSDLYFEIIPAVFLKIKYPLIFRKKNDRPRFAMTPFIEAGGTIDTSLLGFGTGLLIQYRRIAFGGRYRIYYDPYFEDIYQGFGFTFSCDIIRPLFRPRNECK